MERDVITHLRALAEAYAQATGMSMTAVARAATRDGSFFANLETGRTTTLRRVDEIRQWFSDRWPGDLPWPDGPARPEPNPLPHPEPVS